MYVQRMKVTVRVTLQQQCIAALSKLFHPWWASAVYLPLPNIPWASMRVWADLSWLFPLAVPLKAKSQGKSSLPHFFLLDQSLPTGVWQIYIGRRVRCDLCLLALPKTILQTGSMCDFQTGTSSHRVLLWVQLTITSSARMRPAPLCISHELRVKGE